MLQSVEVINRGESRQNGRIVPQREVYINDKLAPKVNGGNSPTGGHAGANKTVYFGDEYVVKIGHMGEAYMMIEEEDRKHFAPVVYVDINKEWYVQKRVDCVPNAEVTEDQADSMRRLARKYDVGDVGRMSGDYYGAQGIYIGHNFTLDLQGTPVIYDYSGDY